MGIAHRELRVDSTLLVGGAHPTALSHEVSSFEGTGLNLEMRLFGDGSSSATSAGVIQ